MNLKSRKEKEDAVHLFFPEERTKMLNELFLCGVRFSELVCVFVWVCLSVFSVSVSVFGVTVKQHAF